MLVQKGGITRDIDPKRLQEYRDKGYAPMPVKAEAKRPGK